MYGFSGIEWDIHTALMSYMHWQEMYALTRYVTVSGKTGIIAHIQVLRNAGFKYSRCRSLPMVVATHNKYSHVLQKCITFQILQWRSNQQLSFPPFKNRGWLYQASSNRGGWRGAGRWARCCENFYEKCVWTN